MTTGNNRNALVLFAIFAMVACGSFLLPRPETPSITTTPPVPTDQRPFATMRSHRYSSGGERSRPPVVVWQEAFDDPDRDAAFRRLIINSTSAQAALVWANSLDEAERRSAYEAITRAWTQCDPQAAAQWAARIQDDVLAKRGLMNTVFETWTESDPKAASAYAAALEQADQSYAIPGVAASWAAMKPADAMEWAESLPDEDARTLAEHSVVRIWASDEPDLVALWAMQQPEGFARADDVRTIVEEWLKQDANAAVAWVSKLEPGPSRDSAYDVIADKFSVSAPTIAVQWANGIDRADLRDARLQRLSSYAQH